MKLIKLFLELSPSPLVYRTQWRKLLCDPNPKRLPINCPSCNKSSRVSLTFRQRFQIRRTVESVVSAAVAGEPHRRRWRLVLLTRHSVSAFQFRQFFRPPPTGFVCFTFGLFLGLFLCANPMDLQKDLFYFLLCLIVQLVFVMTNDSCLLCFWCSARDAQ